MLKNRVAAARAHLERFGVDYILFTNLYNIRYLTGFTGSDSALIFGRDAGWFLTDSRYTTQAGQEVPAFDVVEYRGKLEGITGLLKEKGARRVAFEADHTTVAFFRSLVERLPGCELVPVGSELDLLRLVKEPLEVDALAETARIASEAFLGILEQVKPGAVERELALALEIKMKKAGADDKSFDFIVASGPRGALPHGRASEKALQQGELVTFDFGALKNGYHSDETVTVALGKPDQKQREVYQAVKDAHDFALEAVRPGVNVKDLDSIARDHIAAKGYGDYFGHGLGHGVGLEVHEKPVVSYRGEGVVEEGMVFTIEPGIYIPGWGGVRIEDTVSVTSDGYRILTRVPKELMVL